MPFYTYIITYNDSNYVAQSTHSNFKGFVSSWATDLPIDALKGFSAALKKELERIAYQAPFLPIPNRSNVWKKEIDLKGKMFIVHAIETKA